MRRLFQMLLIVVLVVSQNASMLQIAYASNVAQQLFNVSITEGSTTDKTTLHVTALEDQYENVSIELPAGSVYNQQETEALNSNLEAELQYEVSKHILHLKGQNAIPKAFVLVVEDLNEVEEMTFSVTDEEENMTRETHILQLVNNDQLLMRNIQQEDSAYNVEVATFSETDNISVLFNPVQEPVLSGDDIAYIMEVKLTGSKGEVKDAKLTLNFEETEYITFDQSALNNLAIAGVTPTYEKNQLVYEFDELKKGQSYERVVKFNTVNGYLPEGEKFVVTGSLEGTHVTTSNEEKETGEAKEEPFTVDFRGENTIKASGTLNLSKVAKDKDGNTNRNLYQHDEIILYEMELSIPKRSKGQMYLEPGEEIVLKDTLPNHLVYQRVKEGAAPTTKGQELTWTFQAPSIEEQKQSDMLFYQKVIVETKVSKSAPLDQVVKNKAVATASFIQNINKEDKQLTAANSESSVLIANPVPVGEWPEGTYLMATFYGPKDGKGNIDSNIKNPNPTVSPDALVTVSGAIAPTAYSFERWNDTPNDKGITIPSTNNSVLDFKELTYNIKPGKGLVLETFKVPDEISYRPKVPNAAVPFKNNPKYFIYGIVNGKKKTLKPSKEVQYGKESIKYFV